MWESSVAMCATETEKQKKELAHPKNKRNEKQKRIDIQFLSKSKHTVTKPWQVIFPGPTVGIEGSKKLTKKNRDNVSNSKRTARCDAPKPAKDQNRTDYLTTVVASRRVCVCVRVSLHWRSLAPRGEHINPFLCQYFQSNLVARATPLPLGRLLKQKKKKHGVLDFILCAESGSPCLSLKFMAHPRTGHRRRNEQGAWCCCYCCCWEMELTQYDASTESKGEKRVQLLINVIPWQGTIELLVAAECVEKHTHTLFRIVIKNRSIRR